MFALLVQLQGNAGPMRVLSMAGLMGIAGEELAQEPSPTQIALEEKKAGQGYCEVRFQCLAPASSEVLDACHFTHAGSNLLLPHPSGTLA